MRQKEREQLKSELLKELQLDVVRAVASIMEDAFTRFAHNFYYGTHSDDASSYVASTIGNEFKNQFEYLLHEQVTNIANRELGKRINNEQFIDDIVERIRRKQLG